MKDHTALSYHRNWQLFRFRCGFDDEITASAWTRPCSSGRWSRAFRRGCASPSACAATGTRARRFRTWSTRSSTRPRSRSSSSPRSTPSTKVTPTAEKKKNLLDKSTSDGFVLFFVLDSYEQHNPFFYLWIISSIISSLYAYWWDMKMDWGLFDSNAGENRFLREEIVYTSPVGAEPAEDVRSRNEQPFFPFHRSGLLLLWRRRGLCAALRLGPVAVPGGNGLHPRRSHGLLAVSSRSIPVSRVLLIRSAWSKSTGPFRFQKEKTIGWKRSLNDLTGRRCRRFVWNFFRLENEHLNNCGKFRAVRDISVAPMDASDQAAILKMMDEEDGVAVVNRRMRKKNAPPKAVSVSPISKTPSLWLWGGDPNRWIVTAKGGSWPQRVGRGPDGWVVTPRFLTSAHWLMELTRISFHFFWDSVATFGLSHY